MGRYERRLGGVRSGLCYLDENGVFCRDKRAPVYEEIDCIEVRQAEAIRNIHLDLINSGKLAESHCRILQSVVDDLDFLIRGGRVAND